MPNDGGLKPPMFVLAGLELALNRLLRLDPQMPSTLAPLRGRVIGLEFVGFGMRLYLVPETRGVLVLGQLEGPPDCLLRGTPLALTRMGLAGSGGAGQLFEGSVEIQGDTELAHRFGRIVGELDIDWEEMLSQVAGDVLAHQIGNRVRAARRWGKRTLATLGEDTQEYLQEESRLLPSSHEIVAFMEEVDRLRDDSERLIARWRRTRNRLNKARRERGRNA